MKLLSKNKSLIISSLTIMMCITGAIIVSNSVKADNPTTASATASVTVSSACSMTYNNSSAHTVSMINNSTEENVGITTLTATCNDAGGLAIYAIGYSNDEYGNTNMIGTTGNIATGTSDSTSNWSMRLYTATGSVTPSSITSTFTAVPSSYTKFAELSSGTTGSSALAVNATYRFHISATQPADTYTGKVKYTMVHPSTEVPAGPQTTTTGKIGYYANASDAVGTMGQQDVASEVTLLASNFSRSGYGFAGWSDSFDYATNPNAKFYGPNETITLNTADYSGDNSGFSLYAVWVESEGFLQNSSTVSSICSNLTTAPTNGTANLSSVSALTDSRDNETYAIARLADGHCWMIENLRLESTAAHNSDGTLAQGYSTSVAYGNFGGLADTESTNFSESTTANSLYYSGTQDGTATIDLGTSSYPSYRFPRYNNYNNQSASANRPQNPTSNDSSNNTTNAGIYSYGNYYTWAAAIANVAHYSTNNQSVSNTSLCPTGWHLPTGGMAYASGNTSGVNVTGDVSTFREFYNLGYKTMSEVKTAYEDTPQNGYAYYSSNTTNSAGKTASVAFRSFPNNFLYSGYFGSSWAYDRGSGGYYWSSTAYRNGESYRMYLSSSSVRPGTYSINKFRGLSIRCVSGS